MIVSSKFTYEKARKALHLARTVVPDSHWYITNEWGGWRVVEGV